MRKARITRTMTVTRCTLLCLNVETAEPENRTIELPRTYKDERAVLSACDGFFDEVIRPVKLVHSQVIERRYALDEDVFIKYAVDITGTTDAEKN